MTEGVPEITQVSLLISSPLGSAGEVVQLVNPAPWKSKAEGLMLTAFATDPEVETPE